jgi:hypothetical protein
MTTRARKAVRRKWKEPYRVFGDAYKMEGNQFSFVGAWPINVIRVVTVSLKDYGRMVRLIRKLEK